MPKILEQIKKAIRESGVSRYAISKGTGIDQGQLSRLIHGRTTLGLEPAERLADFLGCEIIFRPKKGKKNG
jgi:transcriptional regulator with XRE-family HTH domain